MEQIMHPGAKTFNNDILLHVDDQTLAKHKYPRIADLLIWPELHEAFVPIDVAAGQRKKRSHRLGLVSLGLGLGALCLASLEPYLHYAPAWMTAMPVVPILGLALLLSALIFGSHILRGADHGAWLQQRLTTERLRQLYFQWLVRRVEPIAATKPGRRDALVRERDLLLSSLRHDLSTRGAAAVGSTVDDLVARDAWLVNKLQFHSGPFDVTTLDEIYRAYAELRFDHQASYAAKKLDEGHGWWPWSPRGKAMRIAEAGDSLTVAAVFFGVAGLVVGVARPNGYENINAVIGAAAVVSAMCVLALRVLDEGVRPRAEVSRYRAYRAEVEELKAKSTVVADFPDRLAVMERMEELSYRELRQFLADHGDASFSF